MYSKNKKQQAAIAIAKKKKANKPKGKQNKLDVNKDGKLTKKDFAMLRGKKKNAKKNKR